MSENCPVCNEVMAVKRYEDKKFYECLYCWSHWISSYDLSKFLFEKDDLEKYVNEITENLIGAGKGKCPSCVDTSLSRTQFNGIELDYCESCGGTLFDHGELNQLYKELFNADFEGIVDEAEKVFMFIRVVRAIFDGLSKFI